MSDAGRALAAAAEALVGTPFRLHGREAGTGLDCVGVVAAGLRAMGRPASVPADYRLRQLAPARLVAAAAANGFVPAEGPDLPGDVLLVRPGPAQVHLLVASRGGGFVEAHGGLGRVVLTPGPLSWPVVCRWRLTD